MEFTNFVFVLNTDAAVTTFVNSGTLTLGGNISIAFGTGRSAESAAMIGTKGVAGIFAYSKTRGVYGGLTLEGGVIVERSSANKKLYDRKLKAKELLTGEVPPPPQAEPLMRILNSETFRVTSVNEQSSARDAPAPLTDAPAIVTPATEPPVAETQATESQSAVATASGASVGTPVTGVPVVGAHATEAPAVEAPAANVQATEAPLVEAPSQQPIEPAASGAMSKPETQVPKEPDTEIDARNASKEAQEQPIEPSVAPENDEQHNTEEFSLSVTQDASKSIPDSTKDAATAPVDETLPPHQFQALHQPAKSPVLNTSDTSKERKS